MIAFPFALLLAVSPLFGCGSSNPSDDATRVDHQAGSQVEGRSVSGYASVLEPVFTDVQRPPNIYHLATWYDEVPVDTEFSVHLGGTEDNHEAVSVSWDAPGLKIVGTSFKQAGWEFGGTCTVAAGNEPGVYKISVEVDDGHEASVSTLTIHVVDSGAAAK